MSFDDNVDFIKELAQKIPSKMTLIVLYRPDTEAAATDLAAFGLITRPFRDGVKFVFDLVPLLMSAKLIICDNYYAFLGGLHRRRDTKIVQIWHAAGAIKKFGWEDRTTANRSKSDKQRFQAVYDHFDEYIVASKAMGNVFVTSYHENFDKMKLLGYPRSDQYLDRNWQRVARQRIYRAAPELKDKRVILYAPTYRPHQSFKLPVGLSDALAADASAIVVVKLHPVLRDRENAVREIGNPRIKFYHELATSDLLAVADTLVTDYSSVAFDFSLLPNAKSLIFFMFDNEQYQKDPGIQDDYLDWLPTKPITTVHELKQAIVAAKPTNFDDFNNWWNTFNDGHATQRVVKRYVQFLKSH
ncbi:CDP-glycerol poly(glycerophosphate) glycerophosphotransferase [Lentilactobacillus kisonensis DSM 19906 = JCM 15041]|uniref:CDP-glycerol:poly(Glycerophosphate) glycerophosphotransferase n=3 Tax=Lentilactobacillus kisonensis TaxID=481722 RepID=H1LJD8_9LACO|nr:CDP-glycerol:poly(glycerophosphate) glycerophosphotransferase [Lentilactobacillus kisonensis F0435]KRL23338.1 CDP-glycerol poly(glycerophosphate) glycerophosphotransferase [Lentilactobacillus kisonensis DSM 19906 = JCM 15041]